MYDYGDDYDGTRGFFTYYWYDGQEWVMNRHTGHRHPIFRDRVTYSYYWYDGQNWVMNNRTGHRHPIYTPDTYAGYPSSEYSHYTYGGHPWVRNRDSGIRVELNL